MDENKLLKIFVLDVLLDYIDNFDNNTKGCFSDSLKQEAEMGL